jgi:hypothetical protein
MNHRGCGEKNTDNTKENDQKSERGNKRERRARENKEELWFHKRENSLSSY